MAGAANPWPVRWSDEPLDLHRLAGRSEFPLLIRLADDITNSLGGTVLRKGDVLKLHGVKSFKKMLLAAAGGGPSLGGGGSQELLAMPLGYPSRVRVLPMRSADHVYATVGDLIRETPRPRAVVAHRRITLPEKNYAIGVGDVLSAICVDKRCTSAGVVDYLQCRHQDRTVGLPASCVGNFTALADETQYTVLELADAFELPQRVKFLPAGSGGRRRPNGEPSQRQGEEGGDDKAESAYARCFAELCECEYVASALQRRQYAVCTDSGSATVAKAEWLYFIPVDCPRDAGGDAEAFGCVRPPPVRVHLPLFHDLASYNAALGRFCDNLSMKHVVDCAPVEKAATFDAYKCTLADGYDLIAPTLPRRKGSSPAGATDPQDTCRVSSSRGGAADDEKAGNQLISVGSISVRRGCASSTDCLNVEPSAAMVAVSGLADMAPSHAGNTYVRMLYSPAARRRSAGTASTTVTASPLVQQYQASSQPATPQASRQKKVKATARWKEKLAQSLSNLRLASGGSSSFGRHSRSGKQHGEASTSPLERRLLTSGGSDRTSTSSAETSDSEDAPPPTVAAASCVAVQSSAGSLHSEKDPCWAGSCGQPPRQRGGAATSAASSEGLYENVSSILLGAGFGRPPQPSSSRRPGLLAGLQPQPVKEIWTPPCSPDYRDASTASLTTVDNSSLECGTSSEVASRASDAALASAALCSAPALPAGLRNGLPSLRPPAAHACVEPPGATTDGTDAGAADRGGLMLLRPNPSRAARTGVAGSGGSSNASASSGDYHVYTSLVFPCSTPPRSASPASQSAEPSADGCVVTNGQSEYGLSKVQNGSSSSLSCCSQPLAWDDCTPIASAELTSRGSPGIIRSLADVPDDLSTLSVIGLCACLRLYNMAAVAEKFLQQQVDGQFFVAMPEAMFRDRCFDLSEFEILKLKRLQNGWRPKMM